MHTSDKETIEAINTNLKDLLDEPNVPNNVRKNVETIIELLNSEEQSIEERKNRVNELLEKVNDDPNIPHEIRTIMYHITAYVEALNNANGNKI